MIYLIDTNIVSYLLQGNEPILEKFERTEKFHKILIPSIVYYEVQRGLFYRDNKKLQKKFDEVCDYYGILPLTTAALTIAAQNYARLKKDGKLIEDSDLLIGSMAVSEQAVLATNNVRHLGRIQDIKIEEWQAE